jgi:hypothetical protein
MNDRDLLDRFGPQPTDLSATALDAARARLDEAMTQPAPAKHQSRRRLPLLVAAAAAAVGMAVTPALVGSDSSIALAAVDPMTFPLTPTALPGDLGEPVFERDIDFVAARYGSTLDGVSIVTDVEDQDYWSIPDDAPTVHVNGHQATVVSRTVHNGTLASAPAVTLIWQSADDVWTAVTGSGSYADPGRVESLAESLRWQPQAVDLTLSVAPAGWSVVTYKEDRILTFAEPGEAGKKELTVALVERPSVNLSDYGAQAVDTVTINGEAAQLGRNSAEAGEPTWILEAQTSTGQAFSLQAPAGLTRDQIIRIAEGVTHRP